MLNVGMIICTLLGFSHLIWSLTITRCTFCTALWYFPEVCSPEEDKVYFENAEARQPTEASHHLNISTRFPDTVWVRTQSSSACLLICVEDLQVQVIAQPAPKNDFQIWKTEQSPLAIMLYLVFHVFCACFVPMPMSNILSGTPFRGKFQTMHAVLLPNSREFGQWNEFRCMWSIL